jgi:hypothetical protein
MAERRTAHEDRGGRLAAAEAGAAAVRSIQKLIGKQAEGVTELRPSEDGWTVGVEVLEDQRIPSSGDILAVYEVELDEEGELTAYRRVARYQRGRGGPDGER